MPLSFGKEKQLCCENSLYLCKSVEREKSCVVKNLFCCLVEEWFYSVNIGGIINDSLFEANRSIVVYLRNGECNHEL